MIGDAFFGDDNKNNTMGYYHLVKISYFAKLLKKNLR